MKEGGIGNDLTGKVGIVTALDTGRCMARVRLPDHDDLVSHWLPVLQGKTLRDKQYWMPDPGEHVICLVDEHAEFGVILGAIYSQADTPPVNSPDKYHVRFEDGAIVEYDRVAHVLYIRAADVVIEGDIQVTGNINATGRIMDDGGNTNHHSH